MDLLFENLEYDAGISPDTVIARGRGVSIRKRDLDYFLGFKVGDQARVSNGTGHNFPQDAAVRIAYIRYKSMWSVIEPLILHTSAARSLENIRLSSSGLSDELMHCLEILNSSYFIGGIIQKPGYREGHNLEEKNAAFSLPPEERFRGQWLRTTHLQRIETPVAISATSESGMPQGYSFLAPNKPGELVLSYMVTASGGDFICLIGNKFCLKHPKEISSLSYTLKKDPEAVEKICSLKIMSGLKSGELFGLKNIKKSFENMQVNREQYKLSLQYLHKKDDTVYDTVLVYDKEKDRNLRFLVSDCRFFSPHPKGFLPLKDRSPKPGKNAVCIKTSSLNLRHKEEVKIVSVRNTATMTVVDKTGKTYLVPTKQFKIR